MEGRFQQNISPWKEEQEGTVNDWSSLYAPASNGLRAAQAMFKWLGFLADLVVPEEHRVFACNEFLITLAPANETTDQLHTYQPLLNRLSEHIGKQRWDSSYARLIDQSQ